MSKKTTQTQHTEVKPTNPEWVDATNKNLATDIDALRNIDPSSLVAGSNPLMNQAAASAASLGSFGGFGAQPSQRSDHAGFASPGGGLASSLVLGTNNQQTQTAGDISDLMTSGVGSMGTKARGGIGVPAQPTASADPYANAMSTFDQMRSAGANTSQGASLLDNLQAYMSPYTKDVVDASLADYDFGAGQAKAQSDLDIRNSGAFGGSGSALAQSATLDALTRGRGTLSAGLRDQAFNTGADLSFKDATLRQGNNQFNAGQQDVGQQRQLAAAGGLADVASAQQTNQRNNIVTQSQIGDIMRQIESQQKMAPISLLSTRAGLNGQMPYNLFNGSVTDGTTTTKTSDPMGTIGSLALGVGGLLAAPLTGGLSLGALGSLGGIGAGLAGASGLVSAARGLGTASYNRANIGG